VGGQAHGLSHKDAGYDVQTITLPDHDIRDEKLQQELIALKPYGILAAPPCTMFSFARTKAKKPRDLKEGMECVRACLNVIWSCMEIEQDTAKKTLPLQFWALENPYHGFLLKFLGKPDFTFDPWEFGDPYQKRTALWGWFNEPTKNPVQISEEQKAKAKTNSTLHTLGTKFDYLKSVKTYTLNILESLTAKQEEVSRHKVSLNLFLRKIPKRQSLS